MSNISFCEKEDFVKLKQFIHENWKENHVLSRDLTLMDFQHKAENCYNFVIAKNLDNQITGILGFIPLSQFDKNLTEINDIWLAIWKIDEKNAEPGTGFTLLKWLEKKIKPQSIGSIGINTEVKKIYDILGYKTGVLKQYYILHPTIQDFKIAHVVNQPTQFFSPKANTSLKEISLEEIEDFTFSFHPHKSKFYLINRYQQHPYFDYLFLGAFVENHLQAIFVIRKIEVNHSSCLRIVDIQGDLTKLDSLYFSFVSLLTEHKAEYIDCLNYGLSENLFAQLGFQLRDAENIIPNYFEPFVKENIDIIIAYKSKITDYIVFKGDSDQDRPNLLNY